MGKPTHVKSLRLTKRTTTSTGLTRPETSDHPAFRRTPSRRMISMALAVDHIKRGTTPRRNLTTPSQSPAAGPYVAGKHSAA